MKKPIPSTSIKFNRVSHVYESYVEAVAYWDGIRFANDSALDVVGIRETKGGGFEVLMWDEDSQRGYKTYRIKKSDLVTL